jgi:hypothetical protein
MSIMIAVGEQLFVAIGTQRRARNVDDYCNGCGTEDGPLVRTREGHSYCLSCAVHEHICEICGSTRLCTQSADEQLHFEEECFK